MGHNVATAMAGIAAFGNHDLGDYATKYLNRINAVGERLEYYVKDALADSFETPYDEKEEAHRETFSYLGNQNNPPDMIVRGSDAYEVKKLTNPMSALALNSSPPKDKLHADDPRILDACRGCESHRWVEKDLFYVIGHVSGSAVRHLFFVQGTCYAAERRTYERMYSAMQGSINSMIDELELERGDTNELGKVRRVDPLGITEMRVRGMWSIKNPLSVFSRHCRVVDPSRFHMFGLMRKEKYDSFPMCDRDSLEGTPGMSVSDITIADPNNPARPVDAVLTKYVGGRA